MPNDPLTAACDAFDFAVADYFAALTAELSARRDYYAANVAIHREIVATALGSGSGDGAKTRINRDCVWTRSVYRSTAGDTQAAKVRMDAAEDAFDAALMGAPDV